jgi:hypothetical protein
MKEGLKGRKKERKEERKSRMRATSISAHTAVTCYPHKTKLINLFI